MAVQETIQISGSAPTPPSPELIVTDLSGHHSGNLPETQKRLIEEGHWKRQRIIVILPVGEVMPTKAALAFSNLIYPPNQAAIKIMPEGFEVGHAYSRAVEAILAHPELSTWEYILTLEHDNTPPPDGVIQLLNALEEHPELDAVSGIYYTVGRGGKAQAWGDPHDTAINFRPIVPTPNGVTECCGIGMGFALWRLAMFKDERIPKPWFETIAGKEGAGTQDLSFWRKARPFGHKCAVDTRCKVGHIDWKGIAGPKGKVW